ncbi:MAG: gamma-D-glutamyl-meso-diaminopimelate peptidase [Clostridia bacterium]|nr:gamma-D-glutamyl-meso-diaminopimelate peptidase [Clostridia bacterium]
METITRPQPMGYGICRGLIRALRGRYRFLEYCPIGQSEAGREIPALQLGSEGPAVLMTAGIHGEERITALVLLRLCEELCAGLQQGGRTYGLELRRIFARRRLWLVPLCNPDGAEIARAGAAAAGPYEALVTKIAGSRPAFWQANARGVDLNHNFDAGWPVLHQMEAAEGITGPACRQWGGPAPESERETQALIQLCRRYPFRYVVALHTQGEEIYWEYGERTPPEAGLMAEIAAAVSGYRAAAPTGLAGHGGFKDWFIQQTGRPGFTVEWGLGRNPLPETAFEPMYDKAREMLLLFAAAM